MAGTLFVVATPIGHLDDITLRALQVLREAALVAAEDTRRTANLLRHFSISTRLMSLHAHNERVRASTLLSVLSRGQSVALVSDAGTPGISDPGSELVAMARAQGFRVQAVPGPSAVAAAVSIAGLKEGAFAFLGFPPSRSKDRKRWVLRCERMVRDVALVFFEAPHRIRQTLGDLAFLGEHQIFVFRELTKVHEETLTGSATQLLATLERPRGEFTVVVPAASRPEPALATPDKDQIVREFGQMTAHRAATRREVARAVGRKFGLSTREIYNLTKDQPQ
jgi:16S rRNA (cytidine1402-2'-O)-methyltransferase